MSYEIRIFAANLRTAMEFHNDTFLLAKRLRGVWL